MSGTIERAKVRETVADTLRDPGRTRVTHAMALVDAGARPAAKAGHGSDERSRLWRWTHPAFHEAKPILTPWPIPRPTDWIARVNRALTKKELEGVRTSVFRGRPFGSESWQESTAKQLGLESTFRARGRPRKANKE